MLMTYTLLHEGSVSDHLLRTRAWTSAMARWGDSCRGFSSRRRGVTVVVHIVVVILLLRRGGVRL